MIKNGALVSFMWWHGTPWERDIKGASQCPETLSQRSSKRISSCSGVALKAFSYLPPNTLQPASIGEACVSSGRLHSNPPASTLTKWSSACMEFCSPLRFCRHNGHQPFLPSQGLCFRRQRNVSSAVMRVANVSRVIWRLFHIVFLCCWHICLFSSPQLHLVHLHSFLCPEN